jgi:hypothetical protein
MDEFTALVEGEAKQFISNVLCIDDEIVYDSQEGKPEASVLLEPGRGNLISAEDDGEAGVPVGGQRLRADRMIAAFARAGILCTPLNPRHIEESYLDAVIAKADVIILDWEIRVPNASGDQPAENYCLNMMKKLKGQDRFRLVIIYTGAGSEDIESEINKICPREPKTNLVWEIWGKPESIYRGSKADYEELPSRIIKKFAAENSGILPAAVLRSLTGIREASFRLLNTFTGDLDKALLYHRMLIPNSEDAEEFCRGILADEFLGIIKDADPGKYISAEYVKKYIAEKDCKFLKSKTPDIYYAPEELNSLLTTTKLTEEEEKKFTKEVKKINSGIKLDDEEILKRFSAISTTRTSENSFLQLGCILEMKGEPQKYYLCLQPPCDSVRLNGDEGTRFIFCGLKPDPASNISFYIKNGRENKAFQVDYRSRYIFVFKGGDTISLKVPLVSENEEKFSCIGQLKPMFAQKIANEFAATISRVGIDQFEWLRLQGQDR